jgi:hypothetical protein
MRTYHVGVTAEAIVTLRISRDGGATLSRRQRGSDGTWHMSGRAEPIPAHTVVMGEFLIRIEQGHSAVFELSSSAPGSSGTRTIIPLGVDLPFHNSELAVRPGAPGATSQSTCVHLRVTSDELHWWTENAAGNVARDTGFPGALVTLRLPQDNEGTIVFSPPQLHLPASAAWQNVTAEDSPCDSE